MASPKTAKSWEKVSGTLNQVLLIIGHINYAWSNTESLLIHLISGLAKVDNETATIIFLSLNTSRARIDFVRRMARAKCEDKELEDRIIALLTDLSRLGKERNALNHSLYAFDLEGGDIKTISMYMTDSPKGLKMGNNTFLDNDEIARISSVVDEIAAVNKEAWAVILKFGPQAIRNTGAGQV